MKLRFQYLLVLTIMSLAFEAGMAQTGNLAQVYRFEGRCYQVFIRDSTAYFGLGSTLKIYDIRNPAAPVQIASNPLGYSIYGLCVEGNYAYIAAGSNGLRVVDLTTPASPKQMGSYVPQYHSAVGVAVAGNYAFPIFGYEGMHVVDVTNKSSIQYKKTHFTGGSVQEIALERNYAFLASGTNGVRMVYVGSPLSPSAAGYFDTGDVAMMTALDSARYVYVADGADGLRIIDTAKPQQTREVGFLQIEGIARSVAAKGDYAYVGSEDGIIRMIDVKNRTRPRPIGAFTTGGIPHRIITKGDYIYVSDIVNGVYVLKNTIAVAYSHGNYDFGTLQLPGSMDWRRRGQCLRSIPGRASAWFLTSRMTVPRPAPLRISRG